MVMITYFLSLFFNMTYLEQGQKAPAFSAISTDGTTISLSDYAGKSNVILYFYPEDMTGGCTKEACHFRDDMAEYKAANTTVLGISLDDQAKHQQFTELQKLNFPLLVDKNGEIAKEYGVPVLGTQAARYTFLIDKKGNLAKIYTKVNPTTHSEELLKDINELGMNK